MFEAITKYIGSRQSRRIAAAAIIFAAALTLRALSCGAEYLPILDDSIQYINFQRSTDFAALIKNNGLLSSRPLAILTDLFFVGRFKDCLIVPVLIFSILHGISAGLYMRLFGRIFKNFGGTAFAVLYALLPLGIEGTYWLSAASRIVPGLFFTAAAANLLEDFIDRGGAWRAALFPILALLSYGFYEQILVLSFALTLLQFIRAAAERKKGAWAAVLSIPALAFYFIFTKLAASDGVLSSRMAVVLPNTPWYFDAFLPDLLRQIGAAFLKGGALTLFKGFARGLTLGVGSIGGALYLIAAAAVGCAVYVFTPHRAKEKPGGCGAGIWVWGILLFLAPIAPYFVIANPWFSLRSTVPSFVGAGLLTDALCRVIFRRERIYAGFCGLMAAVCLTAGLSEISDYRAVGEYDSALAGAILDNADEMSGRVGLLCVEQYPPTGQNYAYHDHVASVGTSDWSLYGKTTAENGGDLSFTPVPLAVTDFSFYKVWNRDIKRISGFDQLWLWDCGELTLTRMDFYQSGGEQDYEIVYSDRRPWGRVFEEGDYGYIEIYG